MALQYRWLALLWLLGLFLMAHHPPYPAILEYFPFDDTVNGAEADWALLTTPGFVASDEPTGLMCKEAFGVEGLLYAAVLGPTHFAMAAVDGVAVTRDGCDVDVLHPVDGRIIDMDGRADVLVVSVSQAGGDGLYASLDGGDSLERVATFSEELTTTAVGLVEESVAVVSAYVTGGEQRGQARLLIVDLDDNTVEVFEDPEGHRYPYVFAASGGLVAWAARGDIRPYILWGPAQEPDRHRVELDVWPLFATFGEDGQLWISGLDEQWQGAARATPDELEVDARLVEHNTNCAVPDADGLWVCSDGFAEAYELWRLDGSEEKQPFYRLAYLEGVRQSCPEESAVTQVCPGVWELLQSSIAQRELPDDQPVDPGDGDGDSSGDLEGPGAGDSEASEGDGNGDDDIGDERDDWIRDSVSSPESDHVEDDDPGDEFDQQETAGCRQSGSGGGSPVVLFLVVLGFFLIHAGGYLTGVDMNDRE